MRRSVLIAPRGRAELVSRDPLDVLQHGEKPRHRVVSEPLDNAAGASNDERWFHNDVDPRRMLLHLLHARAQLPEQPGVWVRLPRRLSRQRRLRWRGPIQTVRLEPSAPDGGREVPAIGANNRVARHPAPRAPVVPQADAERWLRGQHPAFEGTPPGGPGAVQHPYRQGDRGSARRGRSETGLALAAASMRNAALRGRPGRVEVDWPAYRLADAWERYYPADGLGLHKHLPRARTRRRRDYDPSRVEMSFGGMRLQGFDQGHRVTIQIPVFQIQIPVVGQHGAFKPIVTRIGARDRERALELANLGYRDIAERPDGTHIALEPHTHAVEVHAEALPWARPAPEPPPAFEPIGLSILGSTLSLTRGGSHPCHVEHREPYAEPVYFNADDMVVRRQGSELRVRATMPQWHPDLLRLVELTHDRADGHMVTVHLHVDLGGGRLSRRGTVVQLRQHREGLGPQVVVDLQIVLFEDGAIPG